MAASVSVSASYDNALKVWHMETGRVVRMLEGHSDWVNGVAMSGDGRLAVSASDDKTLKVWDVETGRDLRTLQGHSSIVTGVAVSADGGLAVSASDDHTLKVWDLETGKALATFTADAALFCCAFASHQTIIAGDQGGHLHFLKIEEPE
jgi:WD40 repeat protein